MLYTEDEVISYINENDIKFIRLAFCDPFGVQKNISIMPNEAERALKYGFTVDLSEITSFGDRRKIILMPDPSSFSLLPWRPSHGRVGMLFCKMLNLNGEPYSGDSRALLSRTVGAAKDAGFTFSVGTECEFYLFTTGENGMPTSIPHDNAGYMDIAPLDKGENIRREICLTLEEMSIMPESSHHTSGRGQHEIRYKYADPITAADNLMTYRWAVRTIADKSGLSASFAPLPIPDENPNDCNIIITPFKRNTADIPTSEAFMRGIKSHLREMTVFLDSAHGSYRRLDGIKNLGEPVRLTEDGGISGVLVSSPDSLVNPYLAYTLLITAGLSEISDDTTVCRLPKGYSEAVEAADCAFIRGGIFAPFYEIYKNRSDLLKV